MAIALSAVLEEKARTAFTTEDNSAARALAELLACAEESVETGTTDPAELVVPVTVITVRPFGPVEVTLVATIGGRVKMLEGKMPSLDVITGV